MRAVFRKQKMFVNNVPLRQPYQVHSSDTILRFVHVFRYSQCIAASPSRLTCSPPTVCSSPALVQRTVRDFPRISVGFSARCESPSNPGNVTSGGLLSITSYAMLKMNYTLRGHSSNIYNFTLIGPSMVKHNCHSGEESCTLLNFCRLSSDHFFLIKQIDFKKA